MKLPFGAMRCAYCTLQQPDILLFDRQLVARCRPWRRAAFRHRVFNLGPQQLAHSRSLLLVFHRRKADARSLLTAKFSYYSQGAVATQSRQIAASAPTPCRKITGAEIFRP
jgi:hypothetical protein